MYTIKYSGVFAFMAPYSTGRNTYIKSRSFVIPSTLKGIERFLFPELLRDKSVKLQKISRCKLQYESIHNTQEEVTRCSVKKNKNKDIIQEKSVITRGLLYNVSCFIAFKNEEDAKRAYAETIRLSRKEDMLLPKEFNECSDEEFSNLKGIEFVETNEADSQAILVGNNRYDDYSKTYGRVVITR